MFNRSEKANVIAIAASASCALLLFAGLALAMHFDAQSGPSAPLWESPHKTPSILHFILVAIIAGWTLSARFRCTDKTVQKYLTLMGYLGIFWLIVMTVKYGLPEQRGKAVEMLWYLYYLPMTFMPLLLFLSSFQTCFPKATQATRLFKGVAWAIATMVVIAILTNGLHMQAFRFDTADPDWRVNYTYGPVYWITLAWIFLTIIGSPALMVFSSRSELKKVAAALLIPVLLVAAYAGAYILRLPIAFYSNMTVTFTTMLILCTELCLRFRLLPSYTWEPYAFSMLPLPLVVSDENGAVRFKAERASSTPELMSEDMLSPQAMDLISKWKPGMKKVRAKDEAAHISLEASPIAGGFSVLAKNTLASDKQAERLAFIQKQLQEQNELLSFEREVQSVIKLQNERTRLYTNVESSLQQSVLDIESLLAQLPPDDSPENHQRRRHLLMAIKLKVAYCKRKGSLVIASQEDPVFLKDRLTMVVSETASDLNSIGIDCGVLVETSSTLSVRVVELFFDVFYDFVNLALDFSEPTVMIHLSDTPSGEIHMRLMMEGDELEDRLADNPAIENMRQRLSTDFSSCIMELVDDTLMASIVFREGGESHE